jgi:hypothetical protein
MRVDGRTDMTKLIVAFRRFANSPKKVEITTPELATL